MKFVLLVVAGLIAPSAQAEAAGWRTCPSHTPKCAQTRTVRPAQHHRKRHDSWVSRGSYGHRDVRSMSAKQFFMNQMLNN